MALPSTPSQSPTGPGPTVRVPVRGEKEPFQRTLNEVMEDLRGCITTAANVAYTLDLTIDRPGEGRETERALLAVTITRLNAIGEEAVSMARDVRDRRRVDAR